MGFAIRKQAYWMAGYAEINQAGVEIRLGIQRDYHWPGTPDIGLEGLAVPDHACASPQQQYFPAFQPVAWGPNPFRRFIIEMTGTDEHVATEALSTLPT